MTRPAGPAARRRNGGQGMAGLINNEAYEHVARQINAKRAVHAQNDTPLPDRLRQFAVLLGRWLSAIPEHPVVYLVLNQRSFVDDERLFVAWLDGTKVPHPVLVPGDRSSPLGGPADGGVDVVVTGSTERKTELEASWRHVWSEYRETTRLLEQCGLTTWNQLLLFHAANPENFGIVWASEGYPRRALNGSYALVTAQDLVECGLPPITDQVSPNAFYQLKCDGCSCRLDHLVQGVRTLCPVLLEEQANVELAARAMATCLAFHLLRSYSIWGGKAFLSIPVWHHAIPGGTSVISICTIRPLEPEDVVRWQNVANQIFGNLELASLGSHRLTAIPPPTAYQLGGQRLDALLTVDGALWPGQAHNPEHLIFTNTDAFHALLQLHVSYPDGNRRSLRALLASELGMNSLQLLGVPGAVLEGDARIRPKVAKAIRFLKGDVRDFTNHAEGFIDQTGASREWLMLPDEEGVWPTSRQIDLDEKRARQYRLYVNEDRLRQFVGFEAESIDKHTREGRATKNVLIDSRLDEATDPIAWFVVANGRRGNWDGWPSEGNTPRDLRNTAIGLGALFAFYGPVNEAGDFVDEPRVISPGSPEQSPLFLCRCRVYAKRYFATGQSLFLTGLALPLFYRRGT